MSPLIAKKYRVKLEVMTETFVWSGRDLLTGIDIIIQEDEGKKKAYLIDLDKFIDKIMEKKKVSELLGHTKKIFDPRRDLREIARRYGVSLESTSYAVIPVMYEKASRKRYVKEHIRVGGAFSIPGSEVKGVLRTAILSGLVKDSSGGETRKIIASAINKLNPEKKRVGREKRGGKPSIKNVSLELENRLLSVQVVLNEGNQAKSSVNVLKYIQVSDPIDNQVKPVLDGLVVALRRDPMSKTIASIPLIGLQKGSKITYELNILDKPCYDNEVSNSIRNLYEKIIPKLDDYLRRYSLSIIDYEKRLLGRLMNSGATSFYRELFRWEEDVKRNEGVFYIKIGFGTGMYSKTIYLALSHDMRRMLEEKMSHIMRDLSRHKIRRWDSLTLKLIGSRYDEHEIIPFGWIKLELLED